jgi:hypothetical protein
LRMSPGFGRPLAAFKILAVAGNGRVAMRSRRIPAASGEREQTKTGP